MSKPIQHDCFSRQGILNNDIIKEHIVPSLGISAADTGLWCRVPWQLLDHVDK